MSKEATQDEIERRQPRSGLVWMVAATPTGSRLVASHCGARRARCGASTSEARASRAYLSSWEAFIP
jgi:hypothetical protein